MRKVTLNNVVAVLVVLLVPSLALAYGYGEQAYNACRGNNVIDPETGVAYNCHSSSGGSEFDRINCVECTYQWCVDHTFWNRYECVNNSAAQCDANGGCALPYREIVAVPAIR